MPMVNRAAEVLHAKLPKCVQMDDLIQLGAMGLMEAIRRFDPDRGIKFYTYAPNRIRGAMLDGIRNVDWVPRLVRLRVGKLSKAIKELEQKHGREPSDTELRSHMKITASAFDKIKGDSNVTGLGSLEQKLFADDVGRDGRVTDVIVSTAEPADHRSLSKDLIERAMIGLSRDEKLILQLYYEGMTMKEIGKTIGVSEGRISQKHASLLLQLRAKLTNDLREAA